jgi:hypothetical protein
MKCESRKSHDAIGLVPCVASLVPVLPNLLISSDMVCLVTRIDAVEAANRCLQEVEADQGSCQGNAGSACQPRG